MATVEYTALASLVSVVLVVGGTLADAPAIAAAVGAQIRKAHCIVLSGDCYARGGPRPCVVGTRSSGSEHSVSVAVVRLRDGRTVLLEELSDGTFRVSLTQSTGAGGVLQFGVQGRLFGRGVDVDIEGEAGGALAYGRTYRAADAAAAGRLVDRLEDDGPPVGGAIPGLVGFLRGRGERGEAERTVMVSSRAEAQAALEALGLGPSAGVLGGLTASVRVDRRTGDRALGLRFGREATAVLDVALAQAGGGVVTSSGAELVLDHRGRRRELVLRATAAVRGEASLPSGGVAAGGLREVQARIDLTDPQARALADRVLEGDLGAVRALGTQLADRARLDLRQYATTRDESSVGGSVFGIGGSRSTLVETTKLVAAEGREPGGSWARRLDCGPAA